MISAVWFALGFAVGAFTAVCAVATWLGNLAKPPYLSSGRFGLPPMRPKDPANWYENRYTHEGAKPDAPAPAGQKPIICPGCDGKGGNCARCQGRRFVERRHSNGA